MRCRLDKLIESLWCGALSPIRNVSDNEAVFLSYSEYRKAKELLYDALDSEQKRLFEEAERLESEYSLIKEFEIFKEGIKLGKSIAEV